MRFLRGSLSKSAQRTEREQQRLTGIAPTVTGAENVYNTHKYDSVVKHNKFFGYLVTDMQVDDPVHQVEADESDRKEDP